MKLRHVRAHVLAVSHKCPVHIHSCPVLAGNHLDLCIQYPGYRKNMRHLHAKVRAASHKYPVHVHGCPLLAGNH